ncbi:hypothetical protein ACX3O0_15275 [Homoserinimonas sp. A447]
MPDAVRPTKRCLTDLSAPIPDLSVRLSEVDHALVSKAQQLPNEIHSGGGDRVRALTDRIWFKVKTGPWRGAGSDLSDELPQEALKLGQRWWLGAGGARQADSSQRDFYAQLSVAAHRDGPHSCSTEFLLPTKWDIQRLVAEATFSALSLMEGLVRKAAVESLLNSDIRSFVFGDRDVRVRIKVQNDGQAYVAIGATGSLDVTFFVALVSAIPGVPPGDWLPEPEGGLGIEPAPGEVVWSAMLAADAQAQLLAFETYSE